MQTRSILRQAATAFLVVLLCACAQQQIAKKDIPPRPPRESVSVFSLTGRAVINQTGKANTVRMMWEHSPDIDSMGFASPLGSMLAELQRDAQGARWTSADGDTYSAKSADALMAHLTEVPIPIDALALWVTGQVSQDAAIVRKDPSGRLTQAIDRNWAVQVLAYETDLPNALPTSIEVRRGGLTIRLAIEDWQI